MCTVRNVYSNILENQKYENIPDSSKNQYNCKTCFLYFNKEITHIFKNSKYGVIKNTSIFTVYSC